MKSFDTTRIATNGLLIILSLFIIFHLLIMLSVIPFELVWGGRLQDHSQMLSFEGISILVNLMMLAAVGVYAGILKLKVNRMIIQVTLWFMFVLFLFNTAGNALSTNELEKMLFTPLTLLLSLFSLRLAIK